MRAHEEALVEVLLIPCGVCEHPARMHRSQTFPEHYETTGKENCSGYHEGEDGKPCSCPCDGYEMPIVYSRHGAAKDVIWQATVAMICLGLGAALLGLALIDWAG